MQFKIFAALAACVLGCAPILAAPPAFRSNTCPLTMNGTRIGTELTPGGGSLRNTIAYEPFTRLYHFWGFTADDPNFPSAASSLRAVVHATSSDGLHFTSDSNLSYAFGSANYTDFGATIDPPLDFFRAVYDSGTGTWKLFAWTENDQVTNPSFGQYNYNSSVNDLGTVASTTSVVHQGPLTTTTDGGSGGDEVGAFGLVDGTVYQRVDSLYADGSGGGLAPQSYTDGMPPSTPWTPSETTEINLYTATPYCWGLASTCTGPTPIPAYVHNVGRILRQTDGTLGVYYTFRRWDGSRADQQIWYVESADDGATWSVPAGVFAGSAITIDGQPVATTTADGGNGNFSSAEAVQAANVCRTYFSTQDTSGNYIMVSASTGSACDAIFANGFGGCDD
ncbi:MAG: hypothetical protein P4L92_06315 [Rudaea sp.]|nr:hypothetical protein [Rudaea sp.]